jgi:type II restriction/modification system DNA methylase subunit YeeA
MMGRYSLDEPGLIYVHAGNADFNPSRYSSFSADADGIIPITDELWFDEDASNRIREFLCTVWSPDTLEENMAWLAESLGAKAGETSDETIRRYIADKFFKDHLQTYKKRPIYWLFSSGKQGAFQALVYLHRYNEGALARMRAEYVVPLTSKIQSRIEMLEKDVSAASSTAARNKLAKEMERLKKKHVELLAYDEQLRHYADMRINLNLDDGVKVNYGKFGDLYYPPTLNTPLHTKSGAPAAFYCLLFLVILCCDCWGTYLSTVLSVLSPSRYKLHSDS